MSTSTSIPDTLRGRTIAAFSVPPEQIIVIKEKNHLLFRDSALQPPREEMVASIIKMGVIKAVVCRRNGDRLEVIDGRKRVINALEANRRLRELGEPEVKVIVTLRAGADGDLLGASIAGNALRWDDEVIENASLARRYINLGHTLKDVSIAFGRSVDTIENWLKLDDLHPNVRDLVRTGKLKYTVAMRLARLPRERQLGKLRKIMRAGATNANAVRAVVNGHLERVAPPEKAVLRRLADHLLSAKAFAKGESEADAFSFVEWTLGRISTDELLGCLHSGLLANAIKTVSGVVVEERGKKR